MSQEGGSGVIPVAVGLTWRTDLAVLAEVSERPFSRTSFSLAMTGGSRSRGPSRRDHQLAIAGLPLLCVEKLESTGTLLPPSCRGDGATSSVVLKPSRSCCFAWRSALLRG